MDRGTLTEAASKDRPAGEGVTGIWIFIVGDLFIFGAYFVVYAWYRHADPAAFLASQAHLSPSFGAFNTLVLLTSSWCVAAAVKAQRLGDYAQAARLTVRTIVCGLVFVGSKLVEWSEHIRSGHTFTSDIYFQFYYFLTGVHLLHVAFGLIALGRLYIEVSDPRGRNNDTAESCAVFWHMVDLLWLVIFALLYLMR